MRLPVVYPPDDMANDPNSKQEEGQKRLSPFEVDPLPLFERLEGLPGPLAPLPTMTRLNVRCCCQPEKILGTMELPTAVARHPTQIRVPFLANGQVGFGLIDEWTATFGHPNLHTSTVVIELRTFRDFTFPGNHLREELAVYSDDRPVEFWKQFPSFRPLENTNEK